MCVYPFSACRYAKKLIHLNKIYFLQSGLAVVHDTKVSIGDFKSGFQLLRSFGHLITKLKFDGIGLRTILHGAPQHKILMRIMGYIKLYCSKSLVELYIENCPKDGIKYMNKQFPNLELVSFNRCQLMRDTIRNYYFPKLQHLHLVNNIVEDCRCIRKYFSLLKHLEISTNYDQFACDFKKRSITCALAGNPQIQSLRISRGWDAAFLFKASKYLQNIQQLELVNEEYYTLDYCKHFLKSFKGKIHLKNVRKFSMFMFSNKVQIVPEPKIPFSFEQLCEFVIKTDFRLDEHFYRFLKKHPTIIKITLTQEEPFVFKYIRSEIKLKIATALPLLEEIDFFLQRFTIDEAITFMNNSKRLKTFSFTIDKQCNFGDLVACVGNKWKASINHQRYVKLELIK